MRAIGLLKFPLVARRIFGSIEFSQRENSRLQLQTDGLMKKIGKILRMIIRWVGNARST